MKKTNEQTKKTIEEVEEKVLDFKDYTPIKIEDDLDYDEVVLEDVKGTEFKFRFRKPNTAELIRVKREGTILKNDDSGRSFTVLAIEKMFNVIARDFDCLPKKITADILTEASVNLLVDKFCNRV